MPSTNEQMNETRLDIGILELDIIWDLLFVIWNFPLEFL